MSRCLCLCLAALPLFAFAQAPVAPEPAPSVHPSEPPEPSEPVRLRGGFSIGGGYVAGPVGGPIIDLSVRLGAQLNRFFGVMVQTQPNVFFIGSDSGLAAGYAFNNALLAEVTLADMFQLGAGPSLDYAGVAGCSSESCGAASGLGVGVHGRVAIAIGGRDAQTGRRSGFSISANVHPLFLPGTTLFFTTVGVGGDWY